MRSAEIPDLMVSLSNHEVAAWRGLEHHHAANALTRMHHLKTLVDVLKAQCVGDHGVDLNLAVEIPVDDLGHVGAALGTAESGTHPGAAGDQLERTGGD